MVDNQRRSQSHRNRTADGAVALDKQDYLLTLPEDYPTTGNLGNGNTCAREFQVLSAAQCYGLRAYIISPTLVHLRLYRVGDQALIGSKDAVVTTPDTVQDLLFDAPVAVAVGQTYRIGFCIATGNNVSRRTTLDHPDGPVTILTANCYVYASGDVYPATQAGTSSHGVEPIIYV
jgi:hypothetical protein